MERVRARIVLNLGGVAPCPPATAPSSKPLRHPLNNRSKVNKENRAGTSNGLRHQFNDVMSSSSSSSSRQHSEQSGNHKYSYRPGQQPSVVERMLADQRRREESREKNERVRVMRELEQLGNQNQSGNQRKLSSLSSGKKSNRKRSQEEFYR